MSTAGHGLRTSAAPLAVLLLLAAPGATWGEGLRLTPKEIQARLLVGHDSNLLDASDEEREAFERGDASAFFAVDRMSDQFLEGDVHAEWRTGRLFGRLSSLGLGWQHRQFLHNPIKSEDRLGIELQVRPSSRSRVELEGALRPQVYGRHRSDDDALPGEPQFRPEVHHRWDIGLSVLQGAGGRTDLELALESSLRLYREPFEERDRRALGGKAGVARSLGDRQRVRLGGGYRATWSRNQAGTAEDRSHRAWSVDAGVETRALPFLASARIGLELEWRRYTSEDPQDEDHYGRHDQAGQLELRLARTFPAAPLEWITVLARRWRRSNVPSAVFDEDDAFEDLTVRSGVAWSWERP